MKVLSIKEDVFGKGKKLDSEVQQLIYEIPKWDRDEPKQVEFENPQRSLLKILRRELPRLKISAKIADKDPKNLDPKFWYVQVSKRTRKRRENRDVNRALIAAN